MVESMIERVAWAIVDELSEQDGGTWGMDADGKVHYLDQGEVDFFLVARAAIEAMREPTDAMVDCGEDEEGSVNCWQAMIDAALNEQVSG